ncbi:MAG: hypothetical protein FJ138_18330, partial [Deltaproteobacteria bacterium]|nr:hypothetical protein [Deltaproteobacteria bacterium]
MSYSVNNFLVATAGTSYLTREEKATEDSSRKRTSSQKGAHVGFGYYKNIGPKQRTRLSAIAGSAFQTWDYTNDFASEVSAQGDFNGPLGFTRFNASVINPFGQVALTHGSSLSNTSFALRLEKPMIDFSKTEPDTARAKGSPTLLNVALQGKYGLFAGLSFYAQFVYRHNFDTRYFDNLFDDYIDNKNAYEISSWNLYAGLTYELDFGDLFSDTPAEEQAAPPKALEQGEGEGEGEGDGEGAGEGAAEGAGAAA